MGVLFETLFLTVLVIALGLGNVFLSLTDPKRIKKLININKEDQSPVSELGQTTVQDSFSEADTNLEKGGFVVRGKVLNRSLEHNSLDSEADRERIIYLGKRIDRLEQLLLKLNKSDFVAQKINSTNFGQKLSELDTFKQKTKLEIAALKQRLDEVKPVVKKQTKNISNISDKRLHELVFRTK